MTTTLETSALEPSVEPVNQAAADYAELKKLSREAGKAKEKERAASAKWAETVVDAARRAIYSAYGPGSGALYYVDLADAIKENQEAREELENIVELGNEEDEVHYAFGLGMVAGMLYAASTGITLTVPPLAEMKAALDAQEARWQATRQAMSKATPDAPEVA